MGAQKLLRGHDASASLRHPQMAPDWRPFCTGQRHSRLGSDCARTERRMVEVTDSNNLAVCEVYGQLIAGQLIAGQLSADS